MDTLKLMDDFTDLDDRMSALSQMRLEGWPQEKIDAWEADIRARRKRLIEHLEAANRRELQESSSAKDDYHKS